MGISPNVLLKNNLKIFLFKLLSFKTVRDTLYKNHTLFTTNFYINCSKTTCSTLMKSMKLKQGE